MPESDAHVPSQPTPDRVAVKRLAISGTEVAVFEFQGTLRDRMIASLRSNYFATGVYAVDAKNVAPQAMMSMIVAGTAGGTTALSAALAPTLFVATAAPSTLMSIGTGVGSSVLGATGIVSQAPFIPVAASLPILLPLMAVQVLSTAVVLEQFRQVDRKLDAIKASLDTALARAEATHAGELLAASRIVDEVHRQYEIGGSFSTDMLVRLAIAERDVRRLAERFRYLVDTHALSELSDLSEVRRANYDAHSAMLASFLDLRTSYLRVCVDMQENPKYVDASLQELKAKIADGTELWQQLFNRSKALRDAIRRWEVELNEMNWAKRSLPEFVGGQGASAEKRIAALKDAYASTLESEKAIMAGFGPLIESAKRTLAELDAPEARLGDSPALVYWRDEEGEHSFSTDELKIA